MCGYDRGHAQSALLIATALNSAGTCVCRRDGALTGMADGHHRHQCSPSSHQGRTPAYGGQRSQCEPSVVHHAQVSDAAHCSGSSGCWCSSSPPDGCATGAVPEQAVSCRSGCVGAISKGHLRASATYSGADKCSTSHEQATQQLLNSGWSATLLRLRDRFGDSERAHACSGARRLQSGHVRVAWFRATQTWPFLRRH